MSEKTETQIFEDVLSSMLSYVKEQGLDTSESSVAYSLLAPAALGIAGLYLKLEEYESEVFADTATLENLKRIAAERGIEYRDATSAVIQMSLETGSIDLDAELSDRRFAMGERVFYVSGVTDNGDYELTAQTAGTAGRLTLGRLVYLGSIEGISGARATAIISYGKEAETADQLRRRYYDSLTAAEFAGNRAAYKSVVEALPGIGGCRVDRGAYRDINVVITVISEQAGPVSSGVLQSVRDAVADMEPICHNCAVQTVETIGVLVEAQVVLADGYTLSEAQTEAQQNVTAKLKEVAMSWADGGELALRKSDMFTAVLSGGGIEDIKSISVSTEDEEDIFIYKFRSMIIPSAARVVLTEAAV